MTANQKAQARIFFENRILKADKQAFEDLFTEIMSYKELDFRSIKPWGNIGDRKNDGYIPSRGIFYQVYAPEDIRKSYPDIVKKIKTDFTGLVEQWSDVKEFYFVVNDKYKGVNADSEQLLTQIKEDNGLDESKFITASDLENILFSLSDDQIIKITGVSFIDNPILTPAILQNSYLKKFSTISLLTTNNPKPIDDIFVNLAIIKEQKEEKSNDKTINREALLSSYEEIHKPKEPIEIKELVNKSNKSLIYGKAGIGKTTLCKYISYKWAKGELYSEFEYLIYIPLREWKIGGIQGAIRDYYYSHDVKDISIDFDVNKTLFLFDGYDELDGDKKKILRDEIEHYHLSHYIITTRPYGYQKNDFSVNEYFETIGFTDEDVEKYIDTFFKENQDKTKSLKAFLQTNISIKHIAYIPLMLEMICSLWELKEFGSDMTMTELYGQVIENMLKKHSANKDDERVYKRQNRKKIQEQLGKLAFEGLTKQTILFDGDFIEDSITNIEFFEENTIYSGFLKSDGKEKDLLDNSFEFPHLTFQEYFSALYVSKLEPTEQSEIIRDWKFYPHMQMFFAFLGGLIEDKEFLLEEIESEPRDLVGIYELDLISICLSEIRLSDNQKYMEKMILWIEYAIKDEKLFENLFIPLLKKIEVNKVFHKKEIAEAVYNLILKYSKLEFQTHNLIDAVVYKLAYILPIMIKDKNQLCEIYSNVINNTTISIYNKHSMSSGFSLLANTKDISQKLINLIQQEKDVDYTAWLLKALIELNLDDTKSIDLVTDFLKNNYKVLNNQTLEMLCKNFEEIHQKEILVVKLEAILDYSQSDNYNLKELEHTIHNLKARISSNDNRNKESRFQTYHLSKNHVYLLIHKKYSYVNYTVEEYIDDLISVVRNNTFHKYYDRRYALVTLESLDRSDDKILNLAIDYLDSNEPDLKGEAIRLFFSIDRDDNKYLSILEKAIGDFNESRDKYTIWQKLFSIKRQDKKFIDVLMKYVNRVSPEIIKKSVLVKSFSSFKKFYSTIASDMKSESLGTEIDINILFQAYDINLHMENHIISNIIYAKKPLYLKHNKLHTIENGNEISTQKELDKTTLNKIKVLLLKDDCND